MGDGNTYYSASGDHLYNASGQYSVKFKVENDSGCVESLSKPIIILPTPVADFEAVEVCIPDVTNFIDLSTIANPGSIYNRGWDFGDGNVFVGGQKASNTYSSFGAYNVKLSAEGYNGCKDSIIKQVQIIKSPTAGFIGPEGPVELGTPIDFINQSIDFTNWYWSFGDGSMNNFTIDPSHEYVNKGSYSVSLIVENGICSDTITKLVEISSGISAYVPTGFSPNGDGLNDDFLPITNVTEDDEFQFLVFNKWGNVIFEAADYQQGWDGTYQGKVAQNGIYVWSLIVVKGGGEIREMRGKLTLFR